MPIVVRSHVSAAMSRIAAINFLWCHACNMPWSFGERGTPSFLGICSSKVPRLSWAIFRLKICRCQDRSPLLTFSLLICEDFWAVLSFLSDRNALDPAANVLKILRSLGDRNVLDPTAKNVLKILRSLGKARKTQKSSQISKEKVETEATRIFALRQPPPDQQRNQPRKACFLEILPCRFSKNLA